MLQWMREENGPDNWWNRNNPLNNGHGSGGGSGLGSYDSLDTAAFYAADNLLKRSFYTAIVAALEDGTSADRRGAGDLGVAVGVEPLRQRRELDHLAGAGHRGARVGLVTPRGWSGTDAGARCTENRPRDRLRGQRFVGLRPE